MFILYGLGLVIMLGIGLFYGNYLDLGYFVNANTEQSKQQDCNQLCTSVVYL